MVVIDQVGDRKSALQLKNVQKGKYFRVFNYYTSTTDLKIINTTVIIWPGGGKTAPIGRPSCGFDNELCPVVQKKNGKSMEFIIFI